MYGGDGALSEEMSDEAECPLTLIAQSLPTEKQLFLVALSVGNNRAMIRQRVGN